MAPKERARKKQIMIVGVEDPQDPFFPFGPDLYENEHVVYHGTWSGHAPLIEERGMGSGNLAYSQNDIDKLCDLGFEFGFIGQGLNVLEVCAYGVPPNKRRIYLTADYWSAREYACKRGGETIHNAILAIDDLARLFSNKKVRKTHADGLRSKLNQV